jgi:hypothetical protein
MLLAAVAVAVAVATGKSNGLTATSICTVIRRMEKANKGSGRLFTLSFGDVPVKLIKGFYIPGMQKPPLCIFNIFRK